MPGRLVNLVTSAAELAPLFEAWRQSPWLALDTEFVRETTYYSKPCLLQVGDGATSVCIDLVAMTVDDLGPLVELLSAQEVVKVFHSASQDIELLFQLFGACPRPLFDTQIASTLLGEGDQMGYAALVEKRLGIKIDKTLTRTDWSRRPLSEAELAYAADDVRYLAVLYPQLREELVERGRLEWLEEDCARLTDPSRYVLLPEEAWKRLKGIARLGRPIARSTAAALAAWRESEAQRRNRPRKWILEDDAIYRIAERRPDSMEALTSLEVLPPKALEKHGTAILSAITSAQTLAPPDTTVFAALEGDDKRRFANLQTAVRERAERLGIPAPLLAARADLEALARRAPASDHVLPLLGWRREQVGRELLAVAAA